MAAHWIDYWCNAFTPDRRALWDAAIEAQGIPLKVRRDETDSFADAETILARMNELSIATLILPSGEVPIGAGPTEYERFTTAFDDVLKLAEAHPGRFVGELTIDPSRGSAGIERTRKALEHECFVALHIHTHSCNRRFDPLRFLSRSHDVNIQKQSAVVGREAHFSRTQQCVLGGELHAVEACRDVRTAHAELSGEDIVRRPSGWGMGEDLFIRLVEGGRVMNRFQDDLLTIHAKEVIAAVVTVAKHESALAVAGLRDEPERYPIVAPCGISRDHHRMVVVELVPVGLCQRCLTVTGNDPPRPLRCDAGPKRRHGPVALGSRLRQIMVFGMRADN
jgi:hypothetical protein